LPPQQGQPFLSPPPPLQGQRLPVKLMKQDHWLRLKLTQQVRSWAMLLVRRLVRRLERAEISLLPLELELELLQSLARLLRREQEPRPEPAQSAP
jgi:hypothetical protein